MGPKRKNKLFEEVRGDLKDSGLVKVVASESFLRGVNNCNAEGVICIMYDKPETTLGDVKDFLGREDNLESEGDRELVYKVNYVERHSSGYDQVTVREVFPE